jgi:two-component system chemotaxis response regulator CheB
MLAPVRVLVVDDSVVFRKVVSDVIKADPDLQLVGTAANGSICIQKVQQLNPDVITLDLEMPEMDGFEVLKALKKTHPHVKVIVFSIHTARGAAQTMEAMRLGAVDFLSKDINSGDMNSNLERIRSELVPVLKQFARKTPETATGTRTSIPTGRKSTLTPRPTSRLATTTSGRRDILAIGVSTGGPNALAQFLPLLPKSFPLPIVLVQHMPPLFTRLLAERLNTESEIEVYESAGGEALKPGVAYIAPGDHHMIVKRVGAQVVTVLNQGPQENSCRPAVDVLFRSVCDVYGGSVITVILTGMGKDGFLGIQQLKSKGSYVIAQDQASSVVWGMPGIVVEAGLADVVVPIQNVALEVERCLSQSTARPR